MYYNNFYPVGREYGRGYGYDGGYDRGCGCKRSVFNFYRHPAPQPKVMGRLDCVQLEIHTDKFVGESHFDRGPCCEPIPVGVSESVQSFIIKAATNCLEPGTYYTLDIDHPMPDGIFADPTFIQVERCGLFQEPVKLVRTETVFPICDFDGHDHCEIPADPAFPDENLIPTDVDGHILEHANGPLVLPRRFRRNEETRLIPVELDLHGDTAFGDNFVKGISPHPKTLVLFYTNRATFSLCRCWRRRTDY